MKDIEVDKKRFIEIGLDNFQEYEIIVILLSYAIQR